MEMVQIYAAPVKGQRGKVRLFTDKRKFRPKVVKVRTAAELSAEFRLYKTWILLAHGVTVNPRRPNLYRVFLESLPRIVPSMAVIKAKYCSLCGETFKVEDKISLTHKAHERCWEEAGKFEVNMMEALVGWKGWSVRHDKHLSSVDKKPLHLISHGGFVWEPDAPAEADCEEDCELCPGIDHTCGIYAADKIHDVLSGVCGEVYGWGRYIRGENGWRSQFAYPKSFLLEADQVPLIEMLKQYHVPIYVKQPMRVYDPVEDGFEGDEGEYRGAEEDGDSGADQESDAS